MTALEHAAPTTIARPAVTARVANAVRRVLVAWNNRRDFYRLGEMSDVQLADIGLRRSDLSVALDLATSIDPTANLQRIARARDMEPTRRGP